MQANLYVAYRKCDDIINYVKMDTSTILGLDQDVLNQCIQNLLTELNLNRSLLIAPRKILHVNDNSVKECITLTKHSIVGCEPLDTSSARRLAKVRKVLSIVLTPRSYRYVDESQINFMAQSPKRKYIEVHLHPFIMHILEETLNIDVEKEFYLLGETIERALKRDVGVVVASASLTLKETLLTTHLDLILYTIGFAKRERRLMLDLYPREFIYNWLVNQ